MTFLLTGATGFVGGALARRLRGRGDDVRAVVRDPTRGADLAALGVSLHRGDVTDKASMRAPMRGVDGVFHVAGWYKLGVRDAAAAQAINVDGTRHVLELVRELNVPKAVYTSTLAVNSDTRGQIVDESYRFRGRHLSVYDRTKAEAHALAETFAAQGMPLVIVQPGLIYGPGDTSNVRTTLVNFLRGALPMVPARTAFCWAHVDDVVDGHILAMERGAPRRSYFLAGPAHTLVEALEIAAEVSGVRPPRLRMPPAMMKALAAVMGLVEPVASLPPDYTAESLRVLAGTTYLGSNRRAREELGWRPRPLREGWADTVRVEWQRLQRSGNRKGS
jgi:nucleoside-diphosphate-sugar epimerase